jgi:hypothetical protein
MLLVYALFVAYVQSEEQPFIEVYAGNTVPQAGNGDIVSLGVGLGLHSTRRDQFVFQLSHLRSRFFTPQLQDKDTGWTGVLHYRIFLGNGPYVSLGGGFIAVPGNGGDIPNLVLPVLFVGLGIQFSPNIAFMDAIISPEVYVVPGAIYGNDAVVASGMKMNFALHFD